MPPDHGHAPASDPSPARAERRVVLHSLRAMLDSLGEEFRDAEGRGDLLDQDEISRLFKQSVKRRHESTAPSDLS